jgi:hypothetical protein
VWGYRNNKYNYEVGSKVPIKREKAKQSMTFLNKQKKVLMIPVFLWLITYIEKHTLVVT